VSRFSDGDPAYLLGHQYRTDSNLKARMSVHERFRTNPLGWHRWVFDQLPRESAARVLELGAGNGAFWRENIERLPADWTVIITDFSAGVLESARRALGTDGTFARVAPSSHRRMESITFVSWMLSCMTSSPALSRTTRQ
jgi:methylase of polypeptide subunit release factors